MKKIASLFVLLLVSTWSFGQRPYVVLVSFDGFRYDYMTQYNTPTFKDFAAKGVRAEGLIPSFPSKTFPNHFTIVTGLKPGNHGLVDNSFYDTIRHEFYAMSMKERVRDPYYYSGTPLWQLAKQNGLKSASYFWVGSEVSDSARQPDYFLPYNEKIADTVRINQVLRWLRLPEKERPQFITLYFSSPDHEGHNFGPLSDEAKEAVENADQLLNKLMQGIRNTGLPVNVVLVSDHGMRELTQTQQSNLFLEEILPVTSAAFKLSNGGTQVHIYSKNKSTSDSLYTALKKSSKHFSVLRMDEFPKGWAYRHQRIGDVMLTADDGYYFRNGSRQSFFEKVKEGSSFGVHGYDPEKVKDMQGIFLAQGPNVEVGMVIPAFENIHIYPFIARMLRLPLPKDIDGKASVLEKIYKK